MRILIAEDDANILKIAQLVLEKVGQHQVDTATDGGQALAKALANDYDLILLDGMMPIMSGVEVCRAYQEKRQKPRAKVIFLSAKSARQDIDEFLSLGQGYIQKPFDPKNLCKLIDEQISKGAA